MVIQTKCFGKIELGEEKIVHFENGLMGFENYKDYCILYNSDKEEGQGIISWIQSVEEPSLALPVINPLIVKRDYDPMFNDEMLKPLGNISSENLAAFLIMTVPADIKKITANLKAPIIINSDTNQGSQIIVENTDYSVRLEIYDIIESLKKAKEAE